jgi:hypothetical protein
MSRLWSVAVLVFILGTVAVPAGRSVEPPTADKPCPADKDQSDATGKAATDAAALLPKVLREWEKATHAARESRCTFTWTSCDLVHGTRETYRGEVFVCRPDRLRVEVRDAAGKLAFLVGCADGKAKMYWYSTKPGKTSTPISLPALKKC